jgi:hypothetical protein
MHFSWWLMMNSFWDDHDYLAILFYEVLLHMLFLLWQHPISQSVRVIHCCIISDSETWQLKQQTWITSHTQSLWVGNLEQLSWVALTQPQVAIWDLSCWLGLEACLHGDRDVTPKLTQVSVPCLNVIRLEKYLKSLKIPNYSHEHVGIQDLSLKKTNLME